MDAATLTPEDAHEMALAGEVLLVDIRQPSEWLTTGLPASGHAVTMHEPGFLDRLAAIGAAPDRPLALICASGGRSAYLRTQLLQIGWTTVYDVSEGMQGGTYGPGWIRRGLPTKGVSP